MQNNPLNAVDPTGLFVTPLDILDVAFFVQSANEFRNNPGWGTGLSLALDTVSLLPVIPSLGLVTRGDDIADAVKGAQKVFRSGGNKAGEVIDAFKSGRGGKQTQLRKLGKDPKVSSADRGWIKQEINQINRGKRKNIRVPPGKELSHKRGFESSKGYDYSHSDLQDSDLHKLQHKYEGY